MPQQMPPFLMARKHSPIMASGIIHQYVFRKVVNVVIDLTSFDCIDGGKGEKDTKDKESGIRDRC